VQSYLRERNISLHVPLRDALFSSSATSSVSTSSSTPSVSISHNMPEFNTTDCVARQGYNPPRNVYRVPATVDSANPDNPLIATATVTPAPTQRLVVNSEDTEEMDEQGWKIVNVACRVQGRMIIF
jgi:hypothetical protein